jgi:uncharacterized membrane protein
MPFLCSTKNQLQEIDSHTPPPTARSVVPVPAFNAIFPQVLLWFIVVLYVALMLRLVFQLQGNIFGFQTGFDLAIFDQATWLISRGLTPFVTVRGTHIMGDHFSAILYLLAPLYWIWDDTRILLVAQTVALAAGAFPVFALARHKTASPAAALVFATAYLLMPAVQWSNTYEFHPDTFATPCLLAAFWFLTCRRWKLYFLFLSLTALTKETMGLTILALGIYVCLFHSRRVGLLTVAHGVASLIVALSTVRHFNNGAPSAYFLLYANYGHDVPSIIRTVVTHPFAVLVGLNTVGNRQYLGYFLSPLMFLPLLAPEVLAIALPGLFINLLSSRSIMHAIGGGYYAASVTPFFVIAGVVGFSRLQPVFGPKGTSVVTGVLAAWALMALPDGALWDQYQTVVLAPSTPRERQRQQEAAEVVKNLPSTASITAQSTLGAQLSRRAQLYNFPNPFIEHAWGNTIKARQQLENNVDADRIPPNFEARVEQAPVEFIVLCPSSAPFPISQEALDKCIVRLLGCSAYGLVTAGDHILVWRRGADSQQGLQLLQSRVTTRTSDLEDLYWHWKLERSLG